MHIFQSPLIYWGYIVSLEGASEALRKIDIVICGDNKGLYRVRIVPQALHGTAN